MTTTATDPRLQLEQHLHMYRQMAKIRAFEEQVNELYKGAKMPGLEAHVLGDVHGSPASACSSPC
jgi:TPP-dependent pyruvate/acetoin dehydrogenase alpha subunit